jgi:hypothetical protein
MTSTKLIIAALIVPGLFLLALVVAVAAVAHCLSRTRSQQTFVPSSVHQAPPTMFVGG